MAKKTAAVVRQVSGITFAGKTDTNHWVMIDGPEKFGGSGAGTRPKELVLIALGGCAASDVVSILRKKRAPLAGCEVRLNANSKDEHPTVYTDIHMNFVVYGDGIEPQDVERAIELSTTKYCAVSAMLKDSVPITHSYRIDPAAAFMGTPANAEAVA